MRDTGHLLEKEGYKIKILDLGCGQGRHSVLLAEDGHDVIGVDFSKNNIEIAKSKYKCLFCSTQDNIKYYNNYSICQSCLDDIIKKFSE